MIMNSSYLLVSDSNVWVLGGFSFILAQKINDGNMEINHTPTFIIEPKTEAIEWKTESIGKICWSLPEE